MKTLRICLSSELPSVADRDTEYIYLLYDKLLIFVGRNPYYDPYVITDSFPENPITGCIYILFDGTVQSYIGDEVVTIAEIEDSSQAEHLKDIGTTFFIMADKRYLDLTYRRLQLPYHNGTYSLNVSMAHDIKINENSVIRYDGKAQRFYLDGDHDILPRMWPYTGRDTNTATTLVENHCIHTNVRISGDSRNIIRSTPNGLYAAVEGKADAADYAALVAEYTVYKEQTEKILEDLEGTITDAESVVSEDNIWSLIMQALSEYSDNIEAMIEYYDAVGKTLDNISDESREYTDKVFAESQDYIDEVLADLKVEMWTAFGGTDSSSDDDTETTELTSDSEDSNSVIDVSDNLYETTSDDSTDTTSEDETETASVEEVEEEEDITTSDEEETTDDSDGSADEETSEDGSESSDSTSE